jgi:hypothetical protein
MSSLGKVLLRTGSVVCRREGEGEMAAVRGAGNEPDAAKSPRGEIKEVRRIGEKQTGGLHRQRRGDEAQKKGIVERHAVQSRGNEERLTGAVHDAAKLTTRFRLV